MTDNIAAHCRKKGPGRKHNQSARLWAPGVVMLRGVTMAPHWPGGRAQQAKLRHHRESSEKMDAMIRAAVELGKGKRHVR